MVNEDIWDFNEFIGFVWKIEIKTKVDIQKDI